MLIGNFPFKATEKDLLKFLNLSLNTEVEIPVFRHNPGRKIGFAFVSVEPKDVQAVLEFNDEEMMGRKLRVALAKNQSKPDKWRTTSTATVRNSVTIIIVRHDMILMIII